MTETAAFADIVLPATMFLEHDDYYTASGHTFLQPARAVIQPPGECAREPLRDFAAGQAPGREHRGFDLSAWEIMDETLRSSGMWDAQKNLDAGGQDHALPFETAHFLDWAVIDEATQEKPFRLVAAPARTYLNTSFTETPGSVKREQRPQIMLHPQACAALGLAAGELVRVGNDLGSILIHVKPFDGVLPGTVVIESIWPNGAFVEGRGVNTLISADAGSPRGGAVFHDTAVWLRRP